MNDYLRHESQFFSLKERCNELELRVSIILCSLCALTPLSELYNPRAPWLGLPHRVAELDRCGSFKTHISTGPRPSARELGQRVPNLES